MDKVNPHANGLVAAMHNNNNNNANNGDVSKTISNNNISGVVGAVITIPSVMGPMHGAKFNSPDNEPPFSRLFIVCGKNVTEQQLTDAFSQFGTIQYVKLLRDKTTQESKGLSYIKYTKASEAALAIEQMNGVTLNEGDETPIKVMIAEAKTANQTPFYQQQQQQRQQKRRFNNVDSEIVDPDDKPARSRLFVVCSKDLTEEHLEKTFAAFGNFEYAKIIRDRTTQQSKGIAYIKYSKSSTAAIAMETLNGKDSNLKVMFAEPKNKRPEMMKPVNMMPPVFPFMPPTLPMPTMPRGNPRAMMAAAAAPYQQPIPYYAAPPAAYNPVTRLFVLVDKNVTQEDLVRAFKKYPDMEYCDLKRDPNGESKGFAFINFTTPQSAYLAKEQMDGYMIHGSKIRVKFAQPYGAKPSKPKQQHRVNFDANNVQA